MAESSAAQEADAACFLVEGDGLVAQVVAMGKLGSCHGIVDLGEMFADLHGLVDLGGILAEFRGHMDLLLLRMVIGGCHEIIVAVELHGVLGNSPIVLDASALSEAEVAEQLLEGQPADTARAKGLSC